MTSIDQILALCQGRPGFLAGSATAAFAYNKDDTAFDDVDIFMPSITALISMGEHLLNAGASLDSRNARIWVRWLKYGTNKWHTNSVKFHLDDTEINLVYKLTDGHPTTSLSQVLESFDFGLLATGFDMEDGIFRDLRPYLFPGYDIDGPLPLMPNKRDNWRNGFISQYNGLRQAGRYAKYHGYGYDLSLVKDDLVTGYIAAGDYLTDHSDQDKQTLGEIYYVIAGKINSDMIDELAQSYKSLNFKDSLDQIMEVLE